MATREWYFAEGLAETSTTSATVWTTQCTLTFTPKASTTYVIFWSGAMQLNSLTDDGQADLYDVTNSTELVLQNLESQENAAPIDYAAVGGQYFFAATTTNLQSFSIRYKSETAAVTTRMSNARLVALELTSNDSWGESIADSLTTSSTAVEKLRVDITVPVGGGTYAVFGSYHGYASQTATGGRTLYLDNAVIYTRNAGSQYSCDWLTIKDVLNYQGAGYLYRKTWTAGAHYAQLKYGQDGGATNCGISQARILILRLDDGILSDVHYAEKIDMAEGVAGTASYKSVATVSETFQAGNFLVVGWGMVAHGGTTTISQYGRVVLDGTTVMTEVVREPSVSAVPAIPVISAGVVPFTAASHSLAIESKHETGTGEEWYVGAVIGIKLPTRTARYAYYAEGLTEASTTSGTVWSTQATLTFTPKDVSNYAIFWSGSMQLTSATIDGQADLYDVTNSTELVLQNLQGVEITTPIDYMGVGGLFFHKAPSLLLHMDGADEGTTFIDSSPYASTISKFGNVKTDNAQFKFGTTSAFFDGTGDYLTVPSAALVPGTSDFTFQCWYRPSSVAAGYHTIFCARDASDANSPIWIGHSATACHCSLATTPTGYIANDVTWGAAIAADTWYHFALVRFGTNFSCYLNGVKSTVATSAEAIQAIGGAWNIGGDHNDGSNPVTGWIDELSFEIGIARWTAAFTPPTQPYGSESRSWAIRFKSETAGTTTKMKNARLTALELTSDDVIAEALTRTTTTAAAGAATTKLTASITVPTGGRDYLIMSSCHADVAALDKNYVRHEVDDVLTFTDGAESAYELYSDSTTSRYMCVQFVKKTLTAGAHTAKIRWDVNDSGGTAGLEQARILLLCLNDGALGENFYGEDLAGAYSEAGTTTYASHGSATGTFAGGDYLLLSAGTYGCDTITISGYGQVLLDSTQLDEQMREGTDPDSHWNMFTAAKATLSAGSHTLAFQTKVESGTGGNVWTGSALAVQLPATPVLINPSFYMGYGIV